MFYSFMSGGVIRYVFLDGGRRSDVYTISTKKSECPIRSRIGEFRSLRIVHICKIGRE